MISTDDKPKPAPFPADPWVDWKPVWTGGRKKAPRTPQDFQERHAPTTTVALHMPEMRGTQAARRRMVDARLWGNMSGTQQEAARQIALAYETMGRGMGYVQSNWQRIPGARGPGSVAEAHAHLVNAYISWAALCAKEGVSHAMVIDILCFGLTVSQSDDNRRVRHGTSRRNFMEGLSLYCRLCGWPV